MAESQTVPAIVVSFSFLSQLSKQIERKQPRLVLADVLYVIVVVRHASPIEQS
jgi:hypothetical protein